MRDQFTASPLLNDSFERWLPVVQLCEVEPDGEQSATSSYNARESCACDQWCSSDRFAWNLSFIARDHNTIFEANDRRAW